MPEKKYIYEASVPKLVFMFKVMIILVLCLPWVLAGALGVALARQAVSHEEQIRQFIQQLGQAQNGLGTSGPQQGQDISGDLSGSNDDGASSSNSDDSNGDGSKTTYELIDNSGIDPSDRYDKDLSSVLGVSGSGSRKQAKANAKSKTAKKTPKRPLLPSSPDSNSLDTTDKAKDGSIETTQAMNKEF